MYGASIGTARSRFGGASTVKPWLWSSDATAFQLDASAHAPWTRTMVGFGMDSPVMVAGASSAWPRVHSSAARSAREAGADEQDVVVGVLGRQDLRGR